MYVRRAFTYVAGDQWGIVRLGQADGLIGIFDNGVMTTRGLGVTNVEDPLPVTEHTVFPIASISKTFAATMMMRLVEQGKVDLKAPVRKYLPDFKVRDETVSKDVTIWNLLTHTPG